MISLNLARRIRTPGKTSLHTVTTSIPMFSPSRSQSVQMINHFAPLTSLCRVFLINALLLPSPTPLASGASKRATGLQEYRRKLNVEQVT